MACSSDANNSQNPVADSGGGDIADTIGIDVGSDTVENRAPVADAQQIEILGDEPTSITLSGNDLDGDPITFRIDTMPDDGQATLDGNVVTFSPAGFVGTTSFTFVVNDGALDSEPATITVVVDRVDEPPVVTILTPTSGTSFREYERLTLTGTSIDPEDGDISSALVWSSQIDGELGIGTPLESVKLTPGNHELSATDPVSNTSSKVDIEVSLAGPFPTTLLGTSGLEYDDSLAVTESRDIFLCTNSFGELPATPNMGERDVLTYKLNSEGGVEWTSLFGSTMSDRCIDIATDGNRPVVVGSTSGNLQLETNQGNTDAFMIGYTPTGAIDFVKTYGSERADDFLSVAIAPDGKIAAVGRTQGDLFGTPTGNRASNAIIVVLNTDGTTLWEHQFRGGTSSLNEVKFDSDGNLILAGNSSAIWGSTNSNQDAIVGKFAPDGTEIWTRAFGTDGVESTSHMTTIDKEVILTFGTDGIFVPGNVKPDAFDYDLGMIRLDVDGTEVWRHQEPFEGKWTNAQVVGDTSGVYIIGALASSVGPISIFAFEPNGDLRWKETLEARTRFGSIALSYNHLVFSGISNGSRFMGISGMGDRYPFVSSIPTSGLVIQP